MSLYVYYVYRENNSFQQSIQYRNELQFKFAPIIWCLPYVDNHSRQTVEIKRLNFSARKTTQFLRRTLVLWNKTTMQLVFLLIFSLDYLHVVSYRSSRYSAGQEVTAW